MTAFLLGAAWAFWLGIWTSIAPCPLATNIAAVSYISRHVGSTRQVVLAGLLYTLGRMLVYVVLGIFLVASVLYVPERLPGLFRAMGVASHAELLAECSHLLSTSGYKLLGPLMILVGMFLLELVRIVPRGAVVSEKMQKRVDAAGVWGAGLLGVVFAASFCPLPAVLFFGNLIPTAIACRSSVALPLLYGAGTALPVLVFSLAIAFGAQWLGRLFDAMGRVERLLRTTAGVIFVLVGVYFSLWRIFLPLLA